MAEFNEAEWTERLKAAKGMAEVLALLEELPDSYYARATPEERALLDAEFSSASTTTRKMTLKPSTYQECRSGQNMERHVDGIH